MEAAEAILSGDTWNIIVICSAILVGLLIMIISAKVFNINFRHKDTVISVKGPDGKMEERRLVSKPQIKIAATNFARNGAEIREAAKITSKKEQMEHVEDVLYSISYKIEGIFSEWLKDNADSLTPIQKNEMITENEEFMKYVRKYLKREMRDAVRHDFYQNYDADRLKQYSETKTKAWLHKIGRERRFVMGNPELVERFMEYSSKREIEYVNDIHQMFKDTAEIHASHKDHVQNREDYHDASVELLWQNETKRYEEWCKGQGCVE